MSKQPNHEADIKNGNWGTPGTNKTWDQAQGNRGKQMNTNQHPDQRPSGHRPAKEERKQPAQQEVAEVARIVRWKGTVRATHDGEKPMSEEKPSRQKFKWTKSWSASH